MSVGPCYFKMLRHLSEESGMNNPTIIHQRGVKCTFSGSSVHYSLPGHFNFKSVSPVALSLSAIMSVSENSRFLRHRFCDAI